MNRFVLLAVLLAPACRITTTSSPSNMGAMIVTRSMPAKAWEVVEGARRVGYVVRYEAPDAADRAYFSVRNEHGQELGIIDVEGRAWRYRAHASDAEWLGSGTVVQGTRSILEASDRAELDPVDLERLGEVQALAPTR